MSDDQLGEVLSPRTLVEQLLITALHRLAKIEEHNAETKAQMAALIVSQRAADDSRSRIHERLDELAPQVAQVGAQMEAQADRLDALAPIVVMLKDAHIEGGAIRKVVGVVVKNGYAKLGGAVIATGTLLASWEWVRDHALRLFGK